MDERMWVVSADGKERNDGGRGRVKLGKKNSLALA